MTGPCPLCGREGRLEMHHPTGRIKGRPIHPKAFFHICGPCNRAQNSMWQMAGIDAEVPSAEEILRRLTTWLTEWDRPLTIHQYLALVDVLADICDRMTESSATRGC